MKVRVLFFASLRESLNTDLEDIEIASESSSVENIVQLLRERGGQWDTAFSKESALNFSVNQELAGLKTIVLPNSEVAFFPPVTGG